MSKRKRRSHKVERTERVPPSALAESKKRAWSMQLLLAIGREGGGLEADQFEAALEVVSAFRAITGAVGYQMRAIDAAIGGRQSSDFDNATVSLIYRKWCSELQQRMRLQPSVIVGWIEDTARPIAVELLARALDLWLQTKGDLARAQRLTPYVVRVDCEPTGHGLSPLPYNPAYAQAPGLPSRAMGQVSRPTTARAQGQARPAAPISKR